MQQKKIIKLTTKTKLSFVANLCCKLDRKLFLNRILINLFVIFVLLKNKPNSVSYDVIYYFRSNPTNLYC